MHEDLPRKKRWSLKFSLNQARTSLEDMDIGHLTQNECCPNWANTLNLKNSNMDEYFRELFRDVRNWEHFYQIILYLPNSSVPNFGPDLRGPIVEARRSDY